MAARYSEELLRTITRRLLGADPGSLRFRPVGVGKHNDSFWVDSGVGRYVLRIAPPDEAGFLFYERRMMRQEPELHELIQTRTEVPAALVVGSDFSRTLIDRDYLLMEALPGQALSAASWLSQSMYARALQETGAALRQLHALTADDCLGRRAFGYLGAHHPMEPQPTWQDAFCVMWNKLLDDVVDCGTYSPEEADFFRRLLDRHVDRFAHPVEPRLLHMDIWAQNVLIDDTGAVTGLVDFDRALWGDPEIEFAVLDYTGFSDPPFWRGYGAARDTSPSARIRQRFYLLYELQKYMPIRIWRRNDPAGGEEYKRQAFALAAGL